MSWITPESFREAANYYLNNSLSLIGAIDFIYLKENKKDIYAEVEKSVKN
jgi:hypothetical protein